MSFEKCSAEPVVEIVRFNQACNRLEVLRGLSNVPNTLMQRMLRKYSAVNIRHGNANFRLFDLGPECDTSQAVDR